MRIGIIFVLLTLFILGEMFIDAGRVQKSYVCQSESVLQRAPIVVILVLLAIAACVQFVFPRTESPFLNSVFFFGGGMASVGLVIRWYAIAYLGPYFNVNLVMKEDHRIITQGPYKYIRHPSYTGVLLAVLGLGICLGYWFILAMVVLPIVCLYIHRISVEEAMLAVCPEYVAYQARTKKLVPFIY